MTNQTTQSSHSGGAILALRRPSKSLDSDLEKGQSPMTDYEDEKDFSRFSVPSAPEPKRKSGKQELPGPHTKQKHWQPSKAWFILVFPGLVACWIPAILGLTRFPEARVWGVKLLFWSIWLSILWAGWWFALAVSLIWHRVLLIFVRRLHLWALERYVNWLEYLHGYLALVAWTVGLWVSWVPLIAERQIGNIGNDESSTSRSVRAVNFGGRLLFAFAGCTVILLVEKVAIQWIAMKFHQRSYQRRIGAQKEAVEAFHLLYTLSKDAGTSGKHINSPRPEHNRSASERSSIYINKPSFDYHNYTVDRTSTSKLRTAFTDVSGQIFGTSNLARNDVVGRAFHSHGTEKMEKLARRIWSNLVDNSDGYPGSEPPKITKTSVKDRLAGAKDQKGKEIKPAVIDETWNAVTGGIPHSESVTEGEFMRRCSDLHGEQRRLEETMNNLGNVVGRLDDYLMIFWVVGSILIFAVALEAELKSLVIGAGSVFVASSWLVRDAANEVLSSVVFIFSKHPFDVEDQVVINGKKYKVVEVRLLSTVFHDEDSVQVQAPNMLLNTLFIYNLRRSPATSEPLTIEISDLTTPTQLDKFQARMLRFLKDHPKDYRGDFELEIRELSLQSQKMVLYMEIKYNNNWESKAEVRAKRRNDWIFCLRESLRLENIQGPGIPSLQVTTVQSTTVSSEVKPMAL